MSPILLMLLLCPALVVLTEGTGFFEIEPTLSTDNDARLEGLSDKDVPSDGWLRMDGVKRYLGSVMRLRGKKNIGSAMRLRGNKPLGSSFGSLNYKKNMGSAMRLRNKKNMGSAMRLRNKKNMGSAMRLRNKKNMGSAMRLRNKKNMGSAMRNKKNMGSAMRLRYRRHIGMPWRWSMQVYRRGHNTPDELEFYPDEFDPDHASQDDQFTKHFVKGNNDEDHQFDLDSEFPWWQNSRSKRYLGSAMRFRSMAQQMFPHSYYN